MGYGVHSRVVVSMFGSQSSGSAFESHREFCSGTSASSYILKPLVCWTLLTQFLDLTMMFVILFFNHVKHFA